jgi:small conductance mechanosensitive channel
MNRRHIVCVAGWMLGLLAGAGRGELRAGEPPAAGASSRAARSAGGSRPAGGEEDRLSTAERIARLQRAMEEGRRQIEQLKAELADPQGEYARAEASFKALDAEYTAKKREAAPAEADEDEAAALEALEKKWKLARQRFDLAIQERRTRQEQVVTLERKLRQDEEAHARLLAPPAPATQPAATPPEAERGAAEAVATSRPAGESMPRSVVSLLNRAGGGDGEKGSRPSAAGRGPSPKELVEASRDARAKQEAAAQAEEAAASITERMEGLRRSIELERRQLETARKKAENAQGTALSLREEMQAGWTSRAGQESLRELWGKISEAEDRLREARREEAERARRLEGLQAQLSDLQAEQIAALQEAEEKLREAEAARRRVADLENPLAPRNIGRWMLEHGPPVLAILAGMAALLWLMRALRGRLVAIIARGTDRGTSEERENRAATLVSVFRSAATVAITVGGGLMVLTEVGVDIVPLMGGVAVVGLAVAFGAQNLIRDYFSGFMILLENQYGINDVVQISGISGQVERVTLRITVLRDIHGVVHFVPNGQISSVSNKTHEWSRALFEIGVAYKEDVDAVMRVLKELGRELRADPAFADLILEDLEMLGVDALGESAVVIKFYLKTRPLKQWAVKREMLRRIKRRFEDLGIEIPYPHRALLVRQEGGAPPEKPVRPSRPARARSS